MNSLSPEKIRRLVRHYYAEIAGSSKREEDTVARCCCAGGQDTASAAEALGYSEEELSRVGSEANMNLGCGNPVAIGQLQPGETVLDLGSGGGFDCFLAASRVGDAGSVIGVDMTPEMVNRARQNAEKAGVRNVEFRLGEIEHLPVADNSVDVIISNCVINLSPDKAAVFKEAHRVLKPGGRMAIADVVLIADLPAAYREDPLMIAGCVGGALSIASMETIVQAAGFHDVSVQIRENSSACFRNGFPQIPVSKYVAAAMIRGTKP